MDGFLGGLLTSRRSARLAYDPAQQAGMLALALEPRFMFDAAGVVTAEAVQDQSAGQADGGSADAAGHPAADGGSDHPGSAAPVAGQDASHGDAANGGAGEDAAFAQALAEHQLPGSGRTEVVVVDRSLDHADQLIAALPPDTEVIELTPDERGFDQLAQDLAGRHDIDAIHILSHGAPGELRLGGDRITADNLDHYAPALQAIGQTLSADGDLLIYGCDLASTAGGQALAQAIADYSGADVAASTDTTGSALVDGNWDLEYRVGEVEAHPSDALPDRLLSDFGEALDASVGLGQEVSLSAANLEHPGGGLDYIRFISTPSSPSQLGLGSASNSIGVGYVYLKSGFIDTGDIKFRANSGASYSFQVVWQRYQTTGANGPGDTSSTFTIDITMVNPAPTDIALSSTSVVAASAGATVGTLSDTDNSGDSATYSIQSDPSNLFEISGTTLQPAGRQVARPTPPRRTSPSGSPMPPATPTTRPS